MVSPELLEILVCPENRTPLHKISDDLLEKVNGAIANGTLKNRAGEDIKEQLEDGLIREDKQYLYPIRDEIPVMLIDEAVPLDQLS